MSAMPHEDAPVEVLLVHVPNLREKSNEATKINVMPSGIVSISNFLARRGHPNRILHVGIEGARDPEFRLIDYVAATRPKVLLLAIFWHYQAASVFEALDEVKARFPEIATIVGGLTATLFASEILAKRPCVDYVVCGNGELPVLQLLAELSKSSDRSLESVCNLGWRRGEKVVFNPVEFEIAGGVARVPEHVDTEQLSFNRGSLENLVHHEDYLPLYEDYLPAYHLALEYGPCPKNCFSCPMSAESMQTTFPKTKRRFYFDADQIAAEIRALREVGIHRINCTITYNHKGVVSLLRELRERHPDVEVNLHLESCYPFTPETVAELAELTGELQITAYVVGDKNFQVSRGTTWVRAYLERLQETIRFAKARDIGYYGCFLLGDPILSESDYEDILAFTREHRDLHSHIEIYPFTPDPKTEFSSRHGYFDTLEAICEGAAEKGLFDYVDPRYHAVIGSILGELEGDGALHPSLR